MAENRENQAATRPLRLRIRADGPRVGRARLSVTDLVEIAQRTQQALKRVGQVLYGEHSIGQGRKKRDIEALCEIYLVAWKSGSAVAEFELAKPPSQLEMFGYVGEQSLKSFVQGMSAIADGNVTASNIPAGFDAGVLETCDALGKVFTHGIGSLSFQATNGDVISSATFDPPCRERVQEVLRQQANPSSVTKVGRLEELNGHGGLTGRLWEPDGSKWACCFKDEHREQLPDAWMRTVKIVGQATVDERRESRLDVDSILILEEEAASDETRSEGVSFWKSLSLDELATVQEVAPVSDLDEISALWPEDDDPDQLLEHVLNERAARRRIIDTGDAA